MIYNLSCAELAGVIAPGSVDWIITDPPYPEEFLPCWSELGAFAAHALKPGGSLLALTGSMFLPRVFARLEAAAELRYWWTLTFDMSRGSLPGNWVWARHFNQYFKPIIWYWKPGAGAPPPRALLHTDWVRCPGGHVGADQRFHKWGQMEAGMRALAQKFVRPGELVADPFVGGGTTGLAALSLGARFVGGDVDPAAAATARKRLAEYQPILPVLGTVGAGEGLAAGTEKLPLLGE